MLMTKDGKRVVYYGDHIASQHANVFAYLTEALAMVDSANRKLIVASVDLGRVIGISGCVKTTESDNIIYVKRVGRNSPSRVVLNRDGDPCQSVTLILKRKKDYYALITAYIGEAAPREPVDTSFDTQQEYMESIEFWRNHALVASEATLTNYRCTEEYYFGIKHAA